jgi:protein TonB
MTTHSMSSHSLAALRGDVAARHYKPRARFGPVGLGAMALAHLLLGYVLATGLAGQAVEIVRKPLDATLIPEVKLPPPSPTPPPKLEKPKELPRQAEPPPPSFVPPPEVVAAAPAAPALTAVQSELPAPAPPAPPPPAPAPAAPAKADIALVCPRQMAPEVPEKALDQGISGVVKAELRVRGGKVVAVQVLSGPKVFHAAVRAAVSRYECVASEAETVATQEFSFKVE